MNTQSECVKLLALSFFFWVIKMLRVTLHVWQSIFFAHFFDHHVWQLPSSHLGPKEITPLSCVHTYRKPPDQTMPWCASCSEDCKPWQRRWHVHNQNHRCVCRPCERLLWRDYTKLEEFFSWHDRNAGFPKFVVAELDSLCKSSDQEEDVQM